MKDYRLSLRLSKRRHDILKQQAAREDKTMTQIIDAFIDSLANALGSTELTK